MDTKTAGSILERVRAEREKRGAVSVNGQPVPHGNDVLGVGAVTGGGRAGQVIGGLGGAAAGALGGSMLAGNDDVGLKRKGKKVLGAGAGGLLGLLAGRLAGRPAGMALGNGVGNSLEDRSIDLSVPKTAAFDDPSGQAFSDALQGMASTQLKSDAFKDVRNIGLGALGVGAAGRGLVGLIQMMKANKPKKTRSGPAYLPLPYPAEPTKMAGFLDGDGATSKSGIPWYGPAMLLGGLGGLGLGWKGMDKVLDARRQKEQEGELVKAREQFHDALLSQYDAPIKTHPTLMKKRAGDESTMEKVGKALDALYDAFEAAKEDEEKVAVDWSNVAGQAAGGYGMYAGLSGLLTGALVYDKINKRSRRAVLEKALQRRQRRKFMQQPTEIMAVPEPMGAAA